MKEMDRPADSPGIPTELAAEFSSPVPPLELQPAAEQSDATRYSLEELLRHHDRVFVEQLYLAIAKREPTAIELTTNLDHLRSGRRSKTEIIEGLLSDQAEGRQPEVVVDGLPSSALRRVSRWPLVGYVLRVIRGITRLPVLMRHQQEFENYVLGQQQRIADYVNQLPVPAVDHPALVVPEEQFARTLADAVEELILLSDSLLELSGQQAASHEQLQTLAAHLQEIQKQLQIVATQPQELQGHIRNLQERHEKSEAQLHADLLTLTEVFAAQQQEFGKFHDKYSKNNAAQREFLVEEQRLIVEAQKMALKELEEQLHQVQRKWDEKQAELAAAVRQLQELVKPLPPPAAERLGRET